MACQNVLKDAVEAVHISSCFTLKLDSSHVVCVFSFGTSVSFLDKE